MNKEDLLALWKGISWEKHDSGIYFLGRYLNKDINIYFTGYCEQDLVLLSDDLMTSLYRNLEHLDKKAQKVIHDNWPDKAVTELELRELILDKSGSYGEFALGYDAGVSPAGALYLSDNKRLKSGDEMKGIYKAMLGLNGIVLVTIF